MAVSRNSRWEIDGVFVGNKDLPIGRHARDAVLESIGYLTEPELFIHSRTPAHLRILLSWTATLFEFCDTIATATLLPTLYSILVDDLLDDYRVLSHPLLKGTHATVGMYVSGPKRQKRRVNLNQQVATLRCVESALNQIAVRVRAYLDGVSVDCVRDDALARGCNLQWTACPGDDDMVAAELAAAAAAKQATAGTKRKGVNKKLAVDLVVADVKEAAVEEPLPAQPLALRSRWVHKRDGRLA